MQIDDDIENCLSVLKNGGVILYPTDTVWGIGCDATNEDAVEKIFSIKQRNEEKSMIILVANEKDILTYTNHPNPVIVDFIKGVKSPTTVIYDEARSLAKNLVNKDGSVGIRLVKETFCRRLIEAFKKPIVSTSSNISGYPPPLYFDDIDVQIKQAVDYIVKYRRDDFTPAKPSTVVKLFPDGKIKILRS